jgi:DNA-binding transcriptional MerR regulator
MDKDYLRDEFFIDTLRDIGVKIKQCEFIKECNQVGLEIDKFDDVLEIKKNELKQNIEDLIKYIKNNY